MIRVLEAENVTRDLDDRVLNPASSGDERHAALPRKADRLQCAGHASIWARRSDEYAGVRAERRRRATLLDIDRRHPIELDARMPKAGVGCRMSVVGGVVIADDGGARTWHDKITTQKRKMKEF